MNFLKKNGAGLLLCLAISIPAWFLGKSFPVIGGPVFAILIGMVLTLILKEKERTTIQDLQTQEKSCIEKYGRYAQQAKDPELKNLFQTLQQKEREHYDSLERVLNGEVPQCNCNDSDGRDYQPKATYTAMSSPEDKQQDAFLATDCIATEKLVSGEYNSEVFAFGDSGVRKLLADIQVEEQNHAEMLYKYKTVNGMV